MVVVPVCVLACVEDFEPAAVRWAVGAAARGLVVFFFTVVTGFAVVDGFGVVDVETDGVMTCVVL